MSSIRGLLSGWNVTAFLRALFIPWSMISIPLSGIFGLTSLVILNAEEVTSHESTVGSADPYLKLVAS